MSTLRSIFADIAGERPAPLPHVAFHGEQASEKRGRSNNGAAGKVLLRSRVGSEVVAQAKRAARMGGITLSAYVTAQVLDRPPAQPRDENGMTEAYLRRVATRHVVLELDHLERGLRRNSTTVDVPAATAALRSIAASIASGSPLAGNQPDDKGGTVLVASVTRQVFERAHKDARRFESLAAYLSLLIRNPRQPVAPVEPNVLALTLPLTLAGSRVTSAIASIRRRVGGGEDYLAALVPELRAVQRAISDRIVASRAGYDALMDERQGDRDDVAWSAGFLEEDEAP